MKKRIFALALSLAMALSLLSAPAMASNYDFLREAVDYLLVHEDDISEQLTNDTDEDGLARIIESELRTVLPDTEITVKTTIYNWGDVIRKNATTTEKGFLTAQFILTLDGDSQDWTHSFYIPVAEEKQSEIDLMAADKAAIAAAFAGYFATAKIDDTNILQQKKTLQGLMDGAVKYCSEAKFLNGGDGFSTSVKNGYIHGAYRLVLGGQSEEIKLDVTLRADGSATMNSPSLGGSSNVQEKEPEIPSEPAAIYLDDPRCVNISAAQAEKMYKDGERFVLIVCTSDCGWCNQMKKVFPSALRAANYGIYAVLDDAGAMQFPWNFVLGSSLGTPYAVLVNGKSDVEVVSSVRNQEMMEDVLQKAKDRGIPSADGAVDTTPAPTEITVPAIPATGTAYPSTQTVDLDGKKVEFQMYALRDAAGNPTNYVKVRDLALALNGTAAQFSVGWDQAAKVVALTAKASYSPNGSENSTPFSGERAYTVPTNPTNVNGAPSDLQAIVLTDDAGGAYTYYQLRDLGKKLGFNVDWSAAKGVFIETDKPYSEK